MLLTFLGGGAFGNHPDWIYAGLSAALKRTATLGLDVRLVSRGRPSEYAQRLVAEYE